MIHRIRAPTFTVPVHSGSVVLCMEMCIISVLSAETLTVPLPALGRVTLHSAASAGAKVTNATATPYTIQETVASFGRKRPSVNLMMLPPSISGPAMPLLPSAGG
jgi:hypothetical protein